MGWLAKPWDDYPDALGFHEAWERLGAEGKAEASVAGYSVHGRAIPRYDFGQGVPVLLTGLMHGVELVGSLALLEFVSTLVETQSELLRHARLTVLPIVNPDALHANCDRLSRGQRAFKRCQRPRWESTSNRNFPAPPRLDMPQEIPSAGPATASLPLRRAQAALRTRDAQTVAQGRRGDAAARLRGLPLAW